MTTYKMHLPSVDPTTAEGRAKDLLLAVKKEFGMIANLPRVMANSPALMATYSAGYHEFRSGSGFTPAEQELVFLVISRENGCDYCVAAHSIMADMKSNLPPAVTDAIRADTAINDARLAALAEFTRIMLVKRGYPEQSDVDTFLKAGYEEIHILGIILGISVKTISNYTNHVFHTPLDKVFQAREYKAFKLGAKFVQFVRKAAG